MDGLLLARYRTCQECLHRISRHERFTGPEDFSSEFCAHGDTERELSQTFMEGPDGNCPIDRWADRISENVDGHAVRVDKDHRRQDCGPARNSEAWDEWNKKRQRENRREKLKPRLHRAVAKVAQSKKIPADRRTALAVLVAAGRVPTWLAEELDKELREGQ